MAHLPQFRSSLVVKYDPDEIQGMQILEIVRTVGLVATRIGL